MKHAKGLMMAAALAGVLAVEEGYSRKRRQIQTTMPRKWWLRRRARFQMARESRRRNR